MSEYDDEEEYEEESEEEKEEANKSKRDFDPKKDKFLESMSDENYLEDSLRDGFKPPASEVKT